jgi:uncharacterized membrane protein
MQILFISSISLLGLIGFFLASYIYRKKRAKKKLICPMRSNCDSVIHSDFSKILGIPVEVLGMLYYAFIALAYGAVYLLDVWITPVPQILLAISGCSVLFSVYLISLQAFVIKHWCTWCLCSGITSLLIFVLSYIHLLIK